MFSVARREISVKSSAPVDIDGSAVFFYDVLHFVREKDRLVQLIDEAELFVQILRDRLCDVVHERARVLSLLRKHQRENRPAEHERDEQ